MRAFLICLLLAVPGRTEEGGDFADSDAVGEEGYGDGGEYGGMDEYGGGGYGGGYGGYGDDYGGYGGGDYGGGDSTPAFTMLDDIDSVEKFLMDEDTEPAVIGFFNADTNQADIDAFEECANTHKHDMRFAYSVEDDVLAHFKSKGVRVDVYKPPRLVSEKYGDKKKARYPGKNIDATALARFFKIKALPLVGQKTWKSNDRYADSGLPVLTLFVAVDLEKNGKGFDYYANRLRKVAVDHQDILFNIGDKEDFSYILDDYGLDLPGKKDLGVGLLAQGNHYYKMDAESFSVDAVRAFIESYKRGELEPKIKEEQDYSMGDDDEYGEEDDTGPTSVVTLNNENFEEVVKAEGTDVMVEFYAPWCGHCMQLKPVYKKLAAAFDGVPSVTVAAMDATANDIPDGFDVQGYPTIMFLPAGAKDSPVSYDGPRDLDSMSSFIRKNAKIPISDEL